jgi:hypothetical protein
MRPFLGPNLTLSVFFFDEMLTLTVQLLLQLRWRRSWGYLKFFYYNLYSFGSLSSVFKVFISRVRVFKAVSATTSLLSLQSVKIFRDVFSYHLSRDAVLEEKHSLNK